MGVKEKYSHNSAEVLLQESGNYFTEIISLLQPIKLVDRKARVVNSEIRNAFELADWATEEQVINNSQYRYDAYKDEVAVEVELSLHAYTYRDYFKFLLGLQIGKVEIGILIVRHESAQTDPAQVTFNRVVRDLGIFTRIINIPILVLGIS